MALFYSFTVKFIRSEILPRNIRPLLEVNQWPVFAQTANYEKINETRFKYPPSRYRRQITKPEKYTTDPIPVKRLGGRDPKTGRVVVKTIGGGLKHSFFWVDFKRHGPLSGETLIEKVISIKKDDMCRTGHIALVAAGDKKRWILATENMKPGDLIKSSNEIPRIPVQPIEGNAHPLGALPPGTVINSVEKFPGEGAAFIRAAGSSGQILRKIDNFVVIKLPSKREIAVNAKCMCVVGRISNVEHGSTPLGTPQANRLLGNRPRSGLWHRKDGYCGRKIKPLPPLKVYKEKKKSEPPSFQLTA